MVANPEQDFVLKTVESRDVHFVRFWFTDVLGNMKSFAVVPGELESAFEEGMGFDGSSILGFTRIQESDMVAFPDPATFQLVAWRPSDRPVARLFCDVRHPDGTPFAVDGIWRAWQEEQGYTFSFSQITINADTHPLLRRMHKLGDEKRSLVIVLQ